MFVGFVLRLVLRVGSSLITSRNWCHVDIHVILGTQGLTQWQVPTSMFPAVEITQVDLRWLGTWDMSEPARVIQLKLHVLSTWSVISVANSNTNFKNQSKTHFFEGLSPNFEPQKIIRIRFIVNQVGS